MTTTIKIGNSWYVLEDICGIIGPQDSKGLPAEPPKMLLRGGHILSMTEMSEDVIEYIRQLRDPQAISQPVLPPGERPAEPDSPEPPQPAPPIDMEIVNEAGV